MSFYGTSWANIDGEWYRKTGDTNYSVGRFVLDKVWNKKCDQVLTRYVETHGTYLMAFGEKIISEIEAVCGESLQERARYYEYYLLTRAYEMPYTRRLWVESFAAEQNHTFSCIVCGLSHHVLDCHPKVILRQGLNPICCRKCSYLVDRYESFYSEDIRTRLVSLVQSVKQQRDCDLCQHAFNLENYFFTYETFGKKAVDLFYPNLFANVCPACFHEAFQNHSRNSKTVELAGLYELFLLINRVPPEDFGVVFFLCKDRESVLRLIRLLHTMRTPDGYRTKYGSFLKAMIEADIFPKGTRKMARGIMSCAKDGHVCLSIPEKEIDDYLTSLGIRHNKEVHYPESGFRTDWEILEKETRIFIEYFGLIDNEDYARRARQKIELAEKHQIRLIDINPDSDWRAILGRLFET